jgi:hypothetical protein
VSGIVRLRLEGVEQASGYGLNLRFEPPILRLVGRLDSMALGGIVASLRLVHEEEGGVAVGEHLRGRQPSAALDTKREVVLRFAFVGPCGFERTATTRIVPHVYALYANYPNPSIQSTPKKPRSRSMNRGPHLNSSNSSRAVELALCGALTATTI